VDRTAARILARYILADESPAWKSVHRAADRYRPRLQKAAKKAFAAGRVALNRDALVVALAARNMPEVFALASGAIVTVSNTLLPVLEDVLTAVLGASGNLAARNVSKLTLATEEMCVCGHAKTRHQSQGAPCQDCECDKFEVQTQALRALATGFRFDKTNPRAVEWIKEHAAETVTGVSETTRESIRELVESAFEDQFDVDDLADEIEDLLGDESRAETIARTETMLASNQGQLEAWNQATEEGFLTGGEKKEWIVTPDDRLCPICEPMDGVQVAQGVDFQTELGAVDAPPAHPRCRCTIGLAV
jgi:SPP1 gp7 family putative phage head morphogenesis protein